MKINPSPCCENAYGQNTARKRKWLILGAVVLLLAILVCVKTIGG